MARKGGQDRGITQRKDRKGWWVRLYANGRAAMVQVRYEVPGEGSLWPIEGRHSRRDVLPGEIRATERDHTSGVDSPLSRRVHKSGRRE